MIAADGQSGELLLWNALSLFVASAHEVRVDAQAGFGVSGSDVVEHRGHGPQWLPLPVLAYLREKAVFDRIPLRGPRGIMAEAYGDRVRLAKPLVEAPFEDAGAIAIGSSAVGYLA